MATEEAKKMKVRLRPRTSPRIRRLCLLQDNPVVKAIVAVKGT
jgi:hypothetical protein